MHITNDNKNEFEKFYLHDALFKGFSYDYSYSKIAFSMKYEWLHKRYDFVFNNVVFFSTQSFQLWDGGSNVYYAYIKDELPELEKMKDFGGENNYSSLDTFNKGVDYIGVEFILNSGDTILIICESVDVDAVEI